MPCNFLKNFVYLFRERRNREKKLFNVLFVLAQIEWKIILGICFTSNCIIISDCPVKTNFKE